MNRRRKYGFFTVTSVICIEDVPDEYWICTMRPSTPMEKYDVVNEVGTYILAVSQTRPNRYMESVNGGHDWKLAKLWKGAYEVPKCIHTLQLDILSTIPSVAQ